MKAFCLSLPFVLLISATSLAESSSSELQQKYQLILGLIDNVDGQPGNEENPDADPDYQDMFEQAEKADMIQAFSSSDREVACQYKPEDTEIIDFMVKTIRSDKPAKEVIQILKETVFKDEEMDERLILGIRFARKATADRIEAKKCSFLIHLHYSNGLTKQNLRDVLNEAIPVNP